MGEENTLLTQGAKNLRRTDFPSVSAAKLSGESSRAEAEDAARARKKAACFIIVALNCCFVVVWTWFWRVKIFFGSCFAARILALGKRLESRVNVPGSRGAALNLLKSKCINLTLDQDLEGN